MTLPSLLVSGGFAPYYFYKPATTAVYSFSGLTSECYVTTEVIRYKPNFVEVYNQQTGVNWSHESQKLTLQIPGETQEDLYFRYIVKQQANPNLLLSRDFIIKGISCSVPLPESILQNTTFSFNIATKSV